MRSFAHTEAHPSEFAYVQSDKLHCAHALHRLAHAEAVTLLSVGATSGLSAKCAKTDVVLHQLS